MMSQDPKSGGEGEGEMEEEAEIPHTPPLRFPYHHHPASPPQPTTRQLIRGNKTEFAFYTSRGIRGGFASIKACLRGKRNSSFSRQVVRMKQGYRLMID